MAVAFGMICPVCLNIPCRQKGSRGVIVWHVIYCYFSKNF